MCMVSRESPFIPGLPRRKSSSPCVRFVFVAQAAAMNNESIIMGNMIMVIPVAVYPVINRQDYHPLGFPPGLPLGSPCSASMM